MTYWHSSSLLTLLHIDYLLRRLKVNIQLALDFNTYLEAINTFLSLLNCLTMVVSSVNMKGRGICNVSQWQDY